jgi:hypothetical protein
MRNKRLKKVDDVDTLHVQRIGINDPGYPYIGIGNSFVSLHAIPMLNINIITEIHF